MSAHIYRLYYSKMNFLSSKMVNPIGSLSSKSSSFIGQIGKTSEENLPIYLCRNFTEYVLYDKSRLFISMGAIRE